MQSNHNGIPRTRSEVSRHTKPATHGAYRQTKGALTIRTRKVSRLVNQMYEKCPWLEDSDMTVARAYAELEIIGAALFSGLTVLSAVRRDGDDLVARRLVDDHRKNRVAALVYARELGLTPATRRQLAAKNETYDLVAAMAMESDAEPLQVEQTTSGSEDDSTVS